MIITWLPQRTDETLALAKSGMKLSVNGEIFDFSFMKEGDELPAEAVSSRWFSGTIRVVNGELELSLILPNGANASHAERFPQGSVITADGPITLPGSDQ